MKHDATMTIRDDVIEVGNRIYVRATVTFMTPSESAEVTAYARESESKKGMDDSQVTGTASSYARKYALNGLFLIDDTKDADTDEFEEDLVHTRKIAEIADKKIGAVKAKALEEKLNSAGENGVDIDKLLDKMNVKSLADLTEEQHASILRKLGG